MDRQIENLLMKKCAVDPESLIKICSAVVEMNRGRKKKLQILETHQESFSIPTVPM